MAKRTRSNKTTQNPKGNQEKTADIGIQEHSEHTAENKQPESKDNENKDESTCLCKLFTKITEWMCARKNKNSKKAVENATENNDAAKQAEIKQADTVEQPKEQVKLTDILEGISKILGISAILGILIGGFITYFYLYKIDKLSIFPDTLLNPSSLIALITPFGFLSLILSLYFFSTYKLGLSIKTKSNRFESVALFFISLILVLLFMWMLLNEYFLFAILFFAYTLILLVFSRYDILNSKENLSPFQFFVVIVVIILSILHLAILFSNHNAILYFFRFIETPENPSWYLLHNNFQQNNGSQEANGIDKNDLLKLKQKFKCSALSETEKKEKDIHCSPHFEQRNNALFGYMAWNLGDTKVFCPPTVDNTKGNKEEKEKLGKECIVISGKALQIMPESYISTDTDGIDDGNPENTGHDDPAIDINTDVKFKNDLNAQSNAGLNNFNVQPILPIQSNAKNMSIQINYGSCNHDSPRNKDGHPDIGYTDKKICQ